MKSKILIIAITMLSISAYTLTAQSPTERKIDKTGKDVENGVAILKNIFKKKNKDQAANQGESTEGNSEVSTPETTKDSKNTGTGSANKNATKPASVNSNALKPGDVHPDAVVLDVDGMEPFNDGAARVVKGNASALVNSKGEFLIPFNVFQLMPMYDTRLQNGIFVTSNNVIGQTEARNHLGFVNSTGKVITLQKPFAGFGRDVGGYFLIFPGGSDHKSYFYDKMGKMFSITNFVDANGNIEINSWGYRQLNSLFLYRDQNSKYGFRDKNDRIILQPQWEEADNFSDGAALVGLKNEFGEIKYGFIDASGKIIVPLKYTKKPENFSDGLAKVFSNENICDNCGQVYYGYVDKRGEMVINSKDFELLGMMFSPFYHGYAFSYKQVLDKNGQIVSVQDFLLNYGIPQEIIGKGDFVYNPKNVGDGKILVNFKGNPEDRRKQYFALLDLKSKRTLFYWRADVKIDYFDPTSGLAHVIEYGDKFRADIKREGYINEEGIFMIVKGEASKW